MGDKNSQYLLVFMIWSQYVPVVFVVILENPTVVIIFTTIFLDHLLLSKKLRIFPRHPYLRAILLNDDKFAPTWCVIILRFLRALESVQGDNRNRNLGDKNIVVY